MSLCYFEHSFVAQNNIILFMPDFKLRIEVIIVYKSKLLTDTEGIDGYYF